MKRYTARMTEAEILGLLQRGVYRVDAETGTVYGHRGEAVTPFEKDGRLFVRLYFQGNRKRIIALPRLAWMARTGRTVPAGFEIHHRDVDPKSNAWTNLFCLHELDHRKLHDGADLLQQEDPVPF